MLSRLIILLLAAAIAHGYRFRQKRVSDQRLAELETLVALSNMKGNIKTIPYGYGSVDPIKAGRKRRSSSGALIDRLLQSIAHEDDDSIGQERPVIQWPPYFWAANDQPE
ncbi:uncharacterized protein [Halyomorpha halys]|uniref:uncharacterized protein n=1 Tax=Halyomorpha halys TaxID=286706 RepID=UPI0006D4FCCC|nr:uncharacterized protein LOC106692427 [Halyomorpha halys]